MRLREIAFLVLAAPLFGQETLPGTSRLIMTSDLATGMVDGIHRFVDRETAAAPANRARYWRRDYTSQEAYEKSIAANRARLRTIIGAVDARARFEAVSLLADTDGGSVIGRGRGYRIHAVRWPVFEGAAVEGLMLEPDGAPVARVVALPDADWSPEMLAGLESGIPPGAQFARRLAENGCLVLIPTIIDRKDTWSGIPGNRMTNQPHREWIYRMAFEVGRQIVGYEVQAVLAAVDWFARQNGKAAAPIVVAGYGEGGIAAFYSAALDTRVQAALVSGYFQPREQLWKEPIYREIWSLVREFGDADIASLIAPRSLVVEYCRFPVVTGPPPRTAQRNGATPNGTISTPPSAEVHAEFEKAQHHFGRLGVGERVRLVEGGAEGQPGSDAALAALLKAVGARHALRASGAAPQRERSGPNAEDRMHRQFDTWVNYTQRLIRESPKRRQEFWAKLDTSSPKRWKETSQFYRDYIWDEIIGRLPGPTLPMNPRTRLVYDFPKFRGYEVVLDVWPDIFAYGILLLPKDLKPGERRPVVVCQHGLEGRPQFVADPSIDDRAYHHYAATLAEQGFVVYAPQNPYIGQDHFRLLLRKSHPLKLSLFSYILGQHQRTTEWLKSQPFVDPQRIGFYGLSYGGKTAVRVPPLLDDYALSICAGDYNEWVWKTTSIESPYSYMILQEYDMLEFDFANKINYSDLSNLMAPRPFMVERGHRDGVAPDEWVAYEFAITRLFYLQMKIENRVAIEFFDGPHMINGKGTFDFLKTQLHWPQ
ncbi:MAG TPA: dienelactone hydrolase family protein [Bryobacteraceae bacterium]|nr:dienelactone hydrolase family protein [Bryobacteraceae bacterium]